MPIEPEIIEVDETNVSQQGFFCYKSKPKAEGYRRKLNWLKNRFLEGMKTKIVYENGRSVGFIEYIPGESAWRAVNADDYLVIHCIWVVGRGKKKGYGSRLPNDLYSSIVLHCRSFKTERNTPICHSKQKLVLKGAKWSEESLRHIKFFYHQR